MENRMAKIFFRIDDVCPGMDWKKLEKLEKIFDKYGVKPLIGIIPNNMDKSLKNNKKAKYDLFFWNKIKSLVDKGWMVAQHGYRHKYINNCSGLLSITKHSEFCGLDYRKQYQKIKNGKEILENNLGTKINWWMAPAHSFDKTTIKVLKDLKFKYITDGFYFRVIKKNGLIWVPQQLWSLVKMPFGFWTICLHLNSFNDFSGINNFIKNNLESCTNLDLTFNNFGLIDAVFSYFWHFLLRFSRLFKV
jgi:predicted deacetylase